MEFAGLYSHDGNSYDCLDTQGVVNTGKESTNKLVQAVRRYARLAFLSYHVMFKSIVFLLINMYISSLSQPYQLKFCKIIFGLPG